MTGRKIFTLSRLNNLKRFSYLSKNVTNFQVRCAHSQADKKNNIDLSLYTPDIIRNFSIIAHIDHGKSTLADRILEHTGAIVKSGSNQQVLDKLQIEKERGITVKAQTASIFYTHKGKEYMLNLIDTPGHVDFSYEVTRSLNACEGVLLLVDAAQGIQAQTVATFYQAFLKGLVVIPVLNKIDLKSAAPEVVIEQLFNTFDIDPDDVLKVSAKLGTGIDELLTAIIERVPAPTVPESKDLKALLLDSWYESKRHVICQVQVKEGTLIKGRKVRTFHTNKIFDIKNIGILTPDEIQIDALYPGQVGIFTANITKTDDARIGDTITGAKSTIEPLPGFQLAKPMIYAGVFPMEIRDYEQVKAAVNKLTLNDSSVCVSPDSSLALGFGWRMGFLGLLHMEVFLTRLEQEFTATVISTVPSVPYKVHLTNKKLIKEMGSDTVIIDNPRYWPDEGSFDDTFEPIAKATIIAPSSCLKVVSELCESRRGTSLETYSIDNNRILMAYEMPLAEIIIDFFDKLKSITSGYATFDYEDTGYRQEVITKVDIKLNGTVFPELSVLVPEVDARTDGKRICLKLLSHIPRHQFQITIQACCKGKIVARQDINALKKDVTAKCYGGDITRKMKLLKQQAAGKKQMKMFGNIQVPRDTFMEVLRKD